MEVWLFGWVSLVASWVDLIHLNVANFDFFFWGGVGGCDFGFTNDASIAPNGLNLALIWLDLH